MDDVKCIKMVKEVLNTVELDVTEPASWSIDDYQVTITKRLVSVSLKVTKKPAGGPF